MRSPARMPMLRMLSTESNSPLTARRTRSVAVCTMPAGVDRVGRGQRATAISAGSMPSEASLALRGLDVDLLVLLADELDLVDVGHAQELVARRVGEVAQLRVAEAVAGERVEVAEGVAELVVEERARARPAAACAAMSPSFLRTWYQTSGTAAGGVSSRRLTVICVSPGLE